MHSTMSSFSHSDIRRPVEHMPSVVPMRVLRMEHSAWERMPEEEEEGGILFVALNGKAGAVEVV